VFERFTDRARRVLILAQDESRLQGHGFIGTEHLLLGLLRDGEGVAAQVLEEFDITYVAVREQLREAVGPRRRAEGSPPFTPRAKKVMEYALREALQLGHNWVGSEHLLLGLVREGEGVGTQLLVVLGADLARVRLKVIELTSGPGGGSPGRSSPVPSRGVAVRTSGGEEGEVSTRGARRSCSFCGRDLWDVGHHVSTGEVTICETCVGDAQEALASAPSEAREVFLPPRVFGTAPDEHAVAAITRAVVVTFGAVATEDRASVVEDYEELQPLMAEAAGRFPIDDSFTHVERIRFLGGDLAEIRFVLGLRSGFDARFEGQLVRRGGGWMVTRSLVEGVLARAGTTGPPPLS